MSAEAGIWAIVPAAGAGLRMQASIPKQYLVLNGRPVLLGTLARLCSYPRLRGVMVGISAADTHWAGLEDQWMRLPKLLGTYEGGATRARTVFNGLRALSARGAAATDWVMVHDAVRPCVRHADLDRLIEAVATESDGGLLALPLADTVKRADGSGHVVETVPRERLWRALTPQMFPVGALSSALEGALESGVELTDEAAAMEHAGARPILVAGHADNLKITHPGDLALAELFLKRQEHER